MLRLRRRLPVGVLLGCCIALTACGSTGQPGGTGTGAANATAASANTTPGAANATAGAANATAEEPSRDLEFSRCMRAQGVSDFPDPTANGLQIGPGIDPESPAFKAAQQSCSQFLPNQGAPPATPSKDRAAALAFSRCMRSHGVTGFPDPAFTSPRNASRVLALRGMVFAISQTIDPKSPAFRQAAAACRVLTPNG